MIGDPRSTWGNLEDNPVQDMARKLTVCVNLTFT